jgi:hypothetical protein
LEEAARRGQEEVELLQRRGQAAGQVGEVLERNIRAMMLDDPEEDVELNLVNMQN